MARHQIYLDRDTEEIFKKMPRGTPSKVIQKAIIKWETKESDLAFLNEKKEQITLEKEEVEKKLDSINKRIRKAEFKKEMEESPDKFSFLQEQIHAKGYRLETEINGFVKEFLNKELEGIDLFDSLKELKEVEPDVS